MRRSPRLVFAFALAVGWATQGARGEQFHVQTFEGNETQLRLGLTDGDVKLLKHELATESSRVHGGKQAERIVTNAASGSFCFVEYPIAPSLIFEELDVSVWVFASRPGATLAVRVVLPNERDPDTNEPVVTLIKGDSLDVANRWRRLFVRRLDVLLEKQQQLMQAQRKRKVDIRSAYVDQILIDVHGGLGETDIVLDDLRIGPLVAAPRTVVVDPKDEPGADDKVPLNLRDENGAEPKVNRPGEPTGEGPPPVSVMGDKLQVNGRPFLMLGIRRTEAPLSVLREAGLNTVFVDWPADPALLDEAARSNLQLVPMLPLSGPRANTALAGGAGGAGGGGRGVAGEIKLDDRALGFLVGEELGAAEESVVFAASDSIRSKDPARGRPILGDVSMGVRAYSRKLDMVGAHRYPLMTSMELDGYRRWLVERKNIARPGTLFWTTVQTHAPDDYARLVLGTSAAANPKVALGPQPEQIRLLAYNSLAAGCRGLVYSSDQALSESAGGRDRLLQLALLNLELSLVEPFLAGGYPPMVKATSNPRISAAIFRHERGVLVVAMWNDVGSQYVLGQAAINDLQLIVESPPESAQAFQVSLGETRGLKQSRDLGGIRVTIPEFDTVALVVLTTDVTLFARYQELTHQVSQRAATWEKEFAQIQLAKTERTHGRLEAAGRPLANAPQLIAEARDMLAQCDEALSRGDARMAVANGTRCRRACRLVQHLYWTEAQKDQNRFLAGSSGDTAPVDEPANSRKGAKRPPEPPAKDVPLASEPFLTSFQTLPEHYSFTAGLARASFGPNQVPSGDFERDGQLDAVGWSYRPRVPAELAASALLVDEDAGDAADAADADQRKQAEKPKDAARRRVLQLAVTPKEEPAPLIAEDTRVELISPSVPVNAGDVVRIRGRFRAPLGVAGSVDGAMVYDNIGGETLAVRLTAAGGWREFVLYRPIHSPADLRVHLALTGIGAAHFDDLAVEVTSDAVVPLAGQENGTRLR